MGKVVLVACTNVGRYIIEEFINNSKIDAVLVGIVNLNNKQAISKANYDSYSDLIQKYNLPIFYCDNINDKDAVNFIKKLAPDIILQSGWSQKFSDEVLSIPKYACIGEHPAPLPKGRGAACVNWAIITGETNWGDTFFKMVQEYDKGEIYAQKYFRIEPYDDVYTVYEKVAKAAQSIVAENVKYWSEGIFDIIIRDEKEATYYKRRRPEDGEIKTFEVYAKQLHDFIRAQALPYPGAYIKFNNEKLYILESNFDKSRKTQEKCGTIIGNTKNGGILVACACGSVLEILRVKPTGKPTAWAKDYFEEIENSFDF